MKLENGVRRTVFEASSTFKPSGVLTITPQWVHFDMVPTLIYGDCDDRLSINTTSPSWRSVISVLLLHEVSKSTEIRTYIHLMA
jgi:hypothetical protein